MGPTKTITSPTSYGLANKAKMTDSKHVDRATAHTNAIMVDKTTGKIAPHPKLSIKRFRVQDDNVSTS